MHEKIKIFLLFIACWSLIRAIYFIVLSMIDLKKSIVDIKEFFIFLSRLLVGVLMIPFSVLFHEWWFFVILTALYFLFGGGIVVFVILTVLGLILCNVPAILGYLVLKNNT